MHEPFQLPIFHDHELRDAPRLHELQGVDGVVAGGEGVMMLSAKI